METVVWVRGECMNGWKYFKIERQNVSDEHQSGRPVSVATVKSEKMKQWILDYRRVTIDEIAVEFNMSHGSAYNIVHDDLRYRKVWSRWVPRHLSDDHKHAQMICQEHLDRHADKEMLFSNEMWQETSPGCNIMNQRVRDNRCRGSTRRLQPAKNSRHRLLLGKSCWPSFWMSMALYWCTSRKRVKL